MSGDGKIKPEWMKLFEDFPDRFVIGSDQHYPEPKGPQRLPVSLLNVTPRRPAANQAPETPCASTTEPE